MNKPNKPAPAEQCRDGWYFVEITGIQRQVPAWWDSANKEWRSTRNAPYRTQPTWIGPRIPSPDEQPAPRDSCPSCGATNKRYQFCDDSWHQVDSSKQHDASHVKNVSEYLTGLEEPRDAAPCPVTAQELRKISKTAGTLPNSKKLNTLADWLEAREAR